MKFKNVTDVRKWFRNIAFTKNEIALKIKFYNELSEDIKDIPECKNSLKYYGEETERLQAKLKNLIADTKRLFAMLDENERSVLTARYINHIKWDYIEFHVFYSRRQAIRVHDRAILKLVGEEVSDLNEK